MNMKFYRKLPIPQETKEWYPVTPEMAAVKRARDEAIRDIFTGQSDRFLLVIGPCSADKSESVLEYIGRLRRVADKVQDGDTYSEQHEVLMNRTIKKVGEDADNLKANTAIAALMTMLNEFYDKGVNKAEYKTFLALLNPFAPHITEELWQQLGETGLLSVAPWPTYDEAKTVESTVELAVQVNGKLKCTIKLAVDADKQTAIDTAMAEEKVQHAIEGKQIVNLVVK